MARAVQKQSISVPTPPVLAVLPDLSGYRPEPKASVQTADTLQTPRKTGPAVGSGTSGTTRHPLRPLWPLWRRRAIVTVSLLMAILMLIAGKIMTRTQTTTPASPLKGSYMTRFAAPPQPTVNKSTTSVKRP